MNSPDFDVPLAGHTTLRVGGPAWALAEASDVETLTARLAWANERGRSTLILGGGSNLLVSDRGFAGLVLKYTDRRLDFVQEGTEVRVSAGGGLIWDELVAFTARRGWSGLEALSGIPGRVGAAPIQNIGAYGQALADTVTAVHAVDRETGAIHRFGSAECQFGYRDSRFKGPDAGRYVVTQVDFRLTAGPPAPPRYEELATRLAAIDGPVTTQTVRDAVLSIRRSKSMVWDPTDPNHRSAGSFFTNPVVRTAEADRITEVASGLDPSPMPRHPSDDGRVKLSAAWLIQRSGFVPGWGDGPAGLSSRHCLAIINRGEATADDIVNVARHVYRGVKDTFGVTLVPEPSFVGFAEPVSVLLEAD